MQKKYMMIQLTTEQVRRWVLGTLKNSYTNRKLKCKGFLGVSGRYFYRIDFIGKPKQIKFKQVPRCYQDFVSADKPIFKIPSVFVKRWKRSGCK